MTTAERQDCAHVCTAKIIKTTGRTDFLTPESGDRRFWPVDQQQIDDTPPANWVGNITSQGRCTDFTAGLLKSPILSDHYAWGAEPSVRAPHTASRHQSSDAACFSVRISQVFQGRHWITTTQAVTDDFGWLVEVPAC